LNLIRIRFYVLVICFNCRSRSMACNRAGIWKVSSRATEPG